MTDPYDATIKEINKFFAELRRALWTGYIGQIRALEAERALSLRRFVGDTNKGTEGVRT